MRVTERMIQMQMMTLGARLLSEGIQSSIERSNPTEINGFFIHYGENGLHVIAPCSRPVALEALRTAFYEIVYDYAMQRK